MKLRNAAVVAVLVVSGAVCAQSTNPGMTVHYGPNITFEQAKKVAAAAEAEARKNNWPMAIAIVDTAGLLVYFSRADDTQTAAVEVAQDKARSAAMFRRTGKSLQDAVASGGANLRYLVLRGAAPFDGGTPITVDGKIVGGIGISGMAADQDGMVANIGAAAVK